MKHTFVSSSPGQCSVTAITEDPWHDVSLSKKSEEYSHARTSRAKQLLNSLRNFTSAGTTPTASPNRSANSGMVCKIPRACCRYSSPQKQPYLKSSSQLRLSQTAINSTIPFSVESSDVQPFRRRTESDGSSGSATGTIMDLRGQQCDQLSLTSSASSVVDAIHPSEIRRPQSNQMSSIPKSLTEAKRSAPLVNGGATPGGGSGGGSSSLASRIPTAPNASSVVVGAGVAASLGRKTRVAAVAQQKSLLTGRLGVTSPPTQRPIDSHYGSVRRTEMTKAIGQVTAASAGVQGHQGNQTYTLIAYQPTQSDPHRKTQNQPAVLYAIPSNHAFLQQHQIHQILQQQQQQQHSSQSISGIIAPAAVLMSSTRPGYAHAHVHGSSICEAGQQQRTAVTTSSAASLAPPTHRSGELVCTCPPELHQALIEHHQQRQNQQHSQNFLLINRDQAPIQQPDVNQTTLHTERKLSTPDSSQLQSADLHCPQRGREMDAESHVNYLVTLFQVLRTSGVREESFVSAFRLMGLLPQLTDFQKATAVRARNELQQVRVALSDLRQEQVQMKIVFAKEIQCCERQIAVQLKKYERRKGLQQAQPFYDTRIHKVRSDRQNLDNALAAYQTTWSSLIGQLADLEGVIEETGNDVLKGRCRITLQMVSALEDRLQLATSAIEFCCESDPLLRKSIWQHAENEMDSAEQETRILEEQLEQLADLRERSARLNGTITTLKRLAKVNTNTRQNEQQLQRLQSLGGILNPTAADSGSAERKRLMATIRLLQPDHDERMRSIEIQEALRERRKRVFRDPPVFKGPAKALLLNGIHISPIWPEGFSRKSNRNSKLTPDLPDISVANEEPPEISNTTANLPQPLRLPLSTVLVSRLKNPNAPKSKRNVRVKFNMQVYVDGEDQPLPLNYVPEEDNPRSARRKSAPALPSPDEVTPPAPPPRLTSQSGSAPFTESTKCQLQGSPIKMLRYENMDMFLKNIQLPVSEKNANLSAQN